MIEVVDVNGKSVLRHLVSNRDIIQYNMDVSELTTGTYIIILRDSEKIATQRFVKL